MLDPILPFVKKASTLLNDVSYDTTMEDLFYDGKEIKRNPMRKIVNIDDGQNPTPFLVKTEWSKDIIPTIRIVDLRNENNFAIFFTDVDPYSLIRHLKMGVIRDFLNSKNSHLPSVTEKMTDIKEMVKDALSSPSFSQKKDLWNLLFLCHIGDKDALLAYEEKVSIVLKNNVSFDNLRKFIQENGTPPLSDNEAVSMLADQVVLFPDGKTFRKNVWAQDDRVEVVFDDTTAARLTRRKSIVKVRVADTGLVVNEDPTFLHQWKTFSEFAKSVQEKQKRFLKNVEPKQTQHPSPTLLFVSEGNSLTSIIQELDERPKIVVGVKEDTVSDKKDLEQKRFDKSKTALFFAQKTSAGTVVLKDFINSGQIYLENFDLDKKLSDLSLKTWTSFIDKGGHFGRLNGTLIFFRHSTLNKNVLPVDIEKSLMLLSFYANIGQKISFGTNGSPALRTFVDSPMSYGELSAFVAKYGRPPLTIDERLNNTAQNVLVFSEKMPISTMVDYALHDPKTPVTIRANFFEGETILYIKELGTTIAPGSGIVQKSSSEDFAKKICIINELGMTLPTDHIKNRRGFTKKIVQGVLKVEDVKTMSVKDYDFLSGYILKTIADTRPQTADFKIDGDTFILKIGRKALKLSEKGPSVATKILLTEKTLDR